jgi:hypothetical protein
VLFVSTPPEVIFQILGKTAILGSSSSPSSQNLKLCFLEDIKQQSQ